MFWVCPDVCSKKFSLDVYETVKWWTGKQDTTSLEVFHNEGLNVGYEFTSGCSTTYHISILL